MPLSASASSCWRSLLRWTSQTALVLSSSCFSWSLSTFRSFRSAFAERFDTSFPAISRSAAAVRSAASMVVSFAFSAFFSESGSTMSGSRTCDIAFSRKSQRAELATGCCCVDGTLRWQAKPTRSAQAGMRGSWPLVPVRPAIGRDGEIATRTATGGTNLNWVFSFCRFREFESCDQSSGGLELRPTFLVALEDRRRLSKRSKGADAEIKSSSEAASSQVQQSAAAAEHRKTVGHEEHLPLGGVGPRRGRVPDGIRY